MPINVAVLGSTGSIGTQGLDVIEGLGNEYRAWGLSARASVDLVAASLFFLSLCLLLPPMGAAASRFTPTILRI